MRMLWSVTDDSSFVAAASHLSASFASGALPSRCGACAAPLATHPKNRIIATPDQHGTLFIVLLLCNSLTALAKVRLSKRRDSHPIASAVLAGSAAAADGAQFPSERQSTARHSCRPREPQKSDCRWKRSSRPTHPAIPQIQKPASAPRLSHATESQIPRALHHRPLPRTLSHPVSPLP